MSKYVTVLFAALIAVMLLYIYPAAKSFEQQDQISFNIAQKVVTTFVDTVRSKGYITPTMYEDFTEALDLTNFQFDIEMKHDERKYNPIYTDPGDGSSFQNDFEVYYESYFNDQIMKVLFPDNSKDVTDPSRRYYLRTYDFFTVSIKNTNTSNAALLRDFLTNSTTGDPTRILVDYGGMILNEDF